MSRTDGRKGLQGLADPEVSLADAAGQAAQASPGVRRTRGTDGGHDLEQPPRRVQERRQPMISQTRPAVLPRLLTVRGEPVILDSDLAALYTVPTKVLNQAIRRNAGRFPPDFLFRLTAEEWSALRSQIVTLKTGGRGQHRKYLPVAFTELGAIMAASVLNSPRALAMSVYVVRAFVQMRRELLANATLEARLRRIENELLTHNAALRDLYEKLKPLLLPPPDTPRREIGFHAKH